MILQADQLCYGYPQHALFTNLSLQVITGVSLVRGGDGRGKTTLLRLLAGDLALDSGDLQIKGMHWFCWTTPLPRWTSRLTPPPP
ncbi:MAG: hypothetical protein WB821_05610 [Burkholderiaceae bacterium]